MLPHLLNRTLKQPDFHINFVRLLGFYKLGTDFSFIVGIDHVSAVTERFLPMTSLARLTGKTGFSGTTAFDCLLHLWSLKKTLQEIAPFVKKGAGTEGSIEDYTIAEGTT